MLDCNKLNQSVILCPDFKSLSAKYVKLDWNIFKFNEYLIRQVTHYTCICDYHLPFTQNFSPLSLLKFS